MKFLFLLFIIWWVILMTILPIKRSEFEEGMPRKSYLGAKFLISFALSMIVSFFIIKYENNIFEYFK